MTCCYVTGVAFCQDFMSTNEYKQGSQGIVAGSDVLIFAPACSPAPNLSRSHFRATHMPERPLTDTHTLLRSAQRHGEPVHPPISPRWLKEGNENQSRNNVSRKTDQPPGNPQEPRYRHPEKRCTAVCPTRTPSKQALAFKPVLHESPSKKRRGTKLSEPRGRKDNPNTTVATSPATQRHRKDGRKNARNTTVGATPATRLSQRAG